MFSQRDVFLILSLTGTLLLLVSRLSQICLSFHLAIFFRVHTIFLDTLGFDTIITQYLRYFRFSKSAFIAENATLA